MAVSTSDLVQRVRDLLHDNPYETTSTTTTTSTTVAVVDGTRWDEGNVGEWQTGSVGYEQFRVTSVSSNNLTVTRGYNGTTAESHSSGDRVIKDPLFTGRQVQQALAAAVRELWPAVYTVGTVTLSGYAAGVVWHELSALSLDVVKVQQAYGAADDHIGIYGFGTSRPFVVDFNLPTSISSTGAGIRFPAGLFDADNDIFITDKRVITGTSDIEDSGNLPVGECVVMGACARLLQAGELRRVAFGENLDIANSVGTGARLQVGAWYDNQFSTMREVLRQELERRYRPTRKWR